MKAFKKTVAAAAIAAVTCAAAPVYAAISLDGLPGLGNNQLAGYDDSLPDLGGSNNSIGGVGELFVSIVARDPVDSTNNRSYVRDLGITARTFVDSLVGGTLGSLSFSFAPDATLASFLLANAGKNISFNLTAVHNVSGFDPLTFDVINVGMLSTAGEDAASVAAKMPQELTGFSNADAAITQFVRGVNQKTDASPTGNPALNLSATFAPGEFGFHDNNFGGSSTFGFDTEGSLGDPVDFYFLGTSIYPGASPAPALLGTWNLLGDGSLAFTPVPVPAAAWLLGSALVGFVGARRRAAA